MRPGERPVPYPWHALDRVPREAAAQLRDARRAVARAIDPAMLARALGEVLAADVRVASARVAVVAGPLEPIGPAVAFATLDGAARVSLELDRDLARLLVGTAVRRSAALADPASPLDAATLGAVAAIVAHVARRAHGDAGALVALGPGTLRGAPGERRLVVHATVLVDREAFAARAIVEPLRLAPAPRLGGRDALARLGGAPISLPAVAGAALASRAEVAALLPGDAWMPGEGWTVRLEGGALAGELRLAAPRSEQAIAVRVEGEGRLVVLAGADAPLEVEPMQDGTTPMQDDPTSLADAIAEAPVVVRVEVGAVTLAAREWAALSPGDVLALGRRVGDAVVLRVAGHEIARGELVSLDGELGVRIAAREEAR